MITHDGYLTEAVWYWRHSCSGAIWEQLIVNCFLFPWSTICPVLYFCSVINLIILISFYETTLIFCSSNWRPIHANSFPPLYSPRFHTHIGSLWSATAWGMPQFFLLCQSNFPLNLNNKWSTKWPGGYSWSSVHVDVDVVAEGTGWYKHVLARVRATDHCKDGNANHDENSHLLCDAIFVLYCHIRTLRKII